MENIVCHHHLQHFKNKVLSVIKYKGSISEYFKKVNTSKLADSILTYSFERQSIMIKTHESN